MRADVGIDPYIIFKQNTSPVPLAQLDRATAS